MMFCVPLFCYAKSLEYFGLAISILDLMSHEDFSNLFIACRMKKRWEPALYRNMLQLCIKEHNKEMIQ